MFEVDKLQQKLALLEQEINSQNLWDTPQKARTILKEKSDLENTLEGYLQLNERFLEYSEFLKDDLDEDLRAEIEAELLRIKQEAEEFKMSMIFSGVDDNQNCFMDLNAGSGGTESQDWAEMMMRMYLRFAEKLKIKTQIIDTLYGEEAGIKSATIRFSGYNSYGWLKTETGVHRLVRMSPFNAAGKRMTSFASCYVYPEKDDQINIQIDEKDLRIETYRSSGAGGQHVNTTDSAVRITHIPTNTVVTCQNERSQHKNKATAMSMLKSRLYDLEKQKRQEAENIANSKKADNTWGNQIRSYVLQPDQMVKDLRTGHQNFDAKSVLDGNLKDFVIEALCQKI
ncbi:peptide chain release factor 2 [Candidatus Phycorickettsia trachydisci]|uniref:peptide chain release factor 2 n=1 Tax=Candidatus Phycorickettsia trachydisci TaxID=2115978 RepID=UPI000D12392E|nr:peptide chain release factor 2 [Candidatus Phycorickettsia trachydisci]